jgi:hypothetical protein
MALAQSGQGLELCGVGFMTLAGFLIGNLQLGNFVTGAKISHTLCGTRSKGCMDAAEAGGYFLHDVPVTESPGWGSAGCLGSARAEYGGRNRLEASEIIWILRMGAPMRDSLLFCLARFCGCA